MWQCHNILLCSKAVQCTSWSYIAMHWSAQCTNCPTLVGPHQQLAPLCGPYSMALAYSCNDSGTSVHQIDSPRWCHVHQLLICTPASQSGPKLQVLASLPSHSEIYPEFNVGLFDSETIETGTFPTKSAVYLMNFVLLNYCCQDLIFLTSLGKIDESQCPSCSETSNVPVTECYISRAVIVSRALF